MTGAQGWEEIQKKGKQIQEQRRSSFQSTVCTPGSSHAWDPTQKSTVRLFIPYEPMDSFSFLKPNYVGFFITWNQNNLID